MEALGKGSPYPTKMGPGWSWGGVGVGRPGDGSGPGLTSSCKQVIWRDGVVLWVLTPLRSGSTGGWPQVASMGRLAPWCLGTCSCPVQAQNLVPHALLVGGVPDPSPRTVAVQLPPQWEGPSVRKEAAFFAGVSWASLPGQPADPRRALPDHIACCASSVTWAAVVDTTA